MMNLFDLFKRLPLAVQIVIVICILSVGVVVLVDRDLSDRLVHLIQVVPPIIYIPLRSTSKSPADQMASTNPS